VTYVLRYQPPAHKLIARVDVRLDGIWLPSRGPVLAMGEPLACLEITPAGVAEVPLPDVTGQFSSMWGFDDDAIYACGGHRPIAYVRQRGVWTKLALLPGTPHLRDVCGLSARDVYFVGDHGA